MSGPGKFEDEADWVSELWEVAMDEIAHETADGVYVPVILTDEDRNKFAPVRGEWDDVYGVIMREADNGFVTAKLIEDKAEFETIVANIESATVDDMFDDSDDSDDSDDLDDLDDSGDSDD